MQAYRPSRGDPHRSITFHHPALGYLEGIILPGDKVVQFHAIPYATVIGRFKQSTLLSTLEGADRNFKFPGYACPHSYSMEDVQSGGYYPEEKPIESDEFKCLGVTLSVPLTLLALLCDPARNPEQIPKIPVMTYIHGGAFHVGKADAVHDTAGLVAQSIEDERPVMVASLQYRLGAFEFLTTPDGALNVGLHDQRTGLQWIQRFIAGFGGDENRVTVFGESAGGYSICYHMLGHMGSKPMFNRAVIMSGVPGPLMVPIRKQEAEKEFYEICSILNVEERGTAAIDVLSSLPAPRLVEAGDAWVAKGNFWRPVMESSFFAHGSITWDTIPALLAACPWVDALIVGNTAFEGTPYLSVAQALTPKSFRSHVIAGLSEEATSKVLDTYGITPSMDQNLFANAATRWLGDIIFDAPIHALCNQLTTHTDKRVYRYLFDVGNPFVGAPLYKIPHHWVDVYFLFGTLGFRMPTQRLKNLSRRHGQMWVEFANGEAPWSEYHSREDSKDGKVVMVANETEGCVEQDLQGDEKRNERDWARLGSLLKSWEEKKREQWLPLRLTEILGMMKA